jgi:hypothetical protein
MFEYSVGIEERGLVTKLLTRDISRLYSGRIRLLS